MTNSSASSVSQVTLDLIPLYSRISPATKVVPCLLALRAPALARSTHRPPLNLGLALDVSGSMAGPPLANSQRAICSLLDSLQPSDRIAITAYASVSSLVASSQLATPANVAAMKLAVNALYPRDSTNLYDGWLHAANAIAPFATKDVLSRVLLFSDGGANVGLTNPGELSRAVGMLTKSGGIETSTYGIGFNFNEELMVAMGRAGGGQSFYASSADELTGYLETELSLLATTVGLNLQATLTARSPDNLQFAWPPGASSSMSRLIAGASSWAICNLTIPPDLSLKSALSFDASVAWTALDGTPQVSTAHATIKLGKTSSPPVPEVNNRVQELEAANLQHQAQMAAARGDWQTTDRLVNHLQTHAGNNAYLRAVSANLSTLAATRNSSSFAKEALYASSTMATRQVVLDEDATTLGPDALGLRKAEQGKSVPSRSSSSSSRASS